MVKTGVTRKHLYSVHISINYVNNSDRNVAVVVYQCFLEVSKKYLDRDLDRILKLRFLICDVRHMRKYYGFMLVIVGSIPYEIPVTVRIIVSEFV